MVKKHLQTLFEKTIVRYLLVGGFSYVVEIGSLAILHYGLHLSSVVSVAVSFWLGFLVAYILQKVVTFRSRERSKKMIAKQLLMYSALVVWNYLFTLIVTDLLGGVVSVIILRTGVIAITTMWNFVIYKKIFNEKKSPTRKRVTTKKGLPHLYLILSIIILAATTLIWAVLGANIQMQNADTLANSFLLQDTHTFQGALFPGAHTFLLKLPFLWLIQLLGASPLAFVSVTVLVVMLSVGLFGYVLYRIEKRPIVIGTIYLVLAACLLVIVPEPYNGALLPTNMAMITTRNIEYLVFIAAFVSIIKAQAFRSKQFAIACLLFLLLFISDKLFFSLSVGGSLLALVIYAIARKRVLAASSLRWLVASVVGYIASIILLGVLNATHLFHTSTSAGAAPYAVIHSLKQLASGLIYGILGIFTNFGANPVVDVRVIKDLPSELIHRIISPSIITYVIPLLVVIAVFVCFYKIVVRSLRASRKNGPTSQATQLSLMLICASIAAEGVFVLSDHYYPVDSRYLSIVLFAGFVSLVTVIKGLHIRQRSFVRVGAVTGVIILLVIPIVFFSYSQSIDASHETASRNSLIARIMKLHPGSTLLGDYWRVFPVKEDDPRITIDPLDSCLTNRTVLSSSAWQPDLHRQSFSYLLSLDTQLANFPQCNLNDVLATYGKPNSSTVISGSATHPQELLLFYDAGIRPIAPVITPKVTDTILPLELKDIPKKTCDTATIMQFVAHEDDDTLFMNPDLLHDIQAGNCIRSVYLTAGDAGSDTAYWLGRQKGTQAAYDSMLGKDSEVWTDRVVALPGGQLATISNPKGNGKISLIFLHLPDGNLNGQGFPATGRESLSKLVSGAIPTIHPVDNSSTYTADQLTMTLKDLMEAYTPAQVRTQSTLQGRRYKDHSDHNTVGKLVTDAYAQYNTQSPGSSIVYYLGYTVHSMAPNVSANDLTPKTNAFLSFGKYDGAVCHSAEECDTQTTYGLYLRREYTYQN